MIQDWNPDLYLKFDKERTQPSIDLVSRIKFFNPEHIIDIGCGPGNSTQVLVARWPDSAILGVDISPAMIEKAKRDYPNQNWCVIDAGSDVIEGKFDLVFSNATIQWIPDHTELLKKFHSLLSDKGVLAVQLPLFWDMPLAKAIERIAANSRWVNETQGVKDLFAIHDCSFYYDNLSKLFTSIDIWISDYIHILDSQYSILEMIKSTGLKPYLDRLTSDSDRNDFEYLVLSEIKRDYASQNNGCVLFPFKRLFFIANM